MRINWNGFSLPAALQFNPDGFSKFDNLVTIDGSDNHLPLGMSGLVWAVVKPSQNGTKFHSSVYTMHSCAKLVKCTSHSA